MMLFAIGVPVGIYTISIILARTHRKVRCCRTTFTEKSEFWKLGAGFFLRLAVEFWNW